MEELLSKVDTMYLSVETKAEEMWSDVWKEKAFPQTVDFHTTVSIRKIRENWRCPQSYGTYGTLHRAQMQMQTKADCRHHTRVFLSSEQITASSPNVWSWWLWRVKGQELGFTPVAVTWRFKRTSWIVCVSNCCLLYVCLWGLCDCPPVTLLTDLSGQTRRTT